VTAFVFRLETADGPQAARRQPSYL